MSSATADSETVPETLEALQTRHRKEQRDLISRTTQKKKQASKKTRKGVNDECERLERELRERQEAEVAALNGEAVGREDEVDEEAGDDVTITEAVQDMKLDGQESSKKKEEAAQEEDNNNGGGGARKKKPNRAKARLARRDAEREALVREAEIEAKSLPNLREQEHKRMASQLETRKLALHEIRADGHCLYAAVADQLKTRELGVKPSIPVTIADAESGAEYKKVRHAAADWIQAHGDDFAGFMQDPLPEHVRKIRETGEWGGHLELLALARTYGVRICVLHSDGHVDKIEPEGDDKDREEIWLGYYQHSHGLGEHYNSLRKAG